MKKFVWLIFFFPACLTAQELDTLQADTLVEDTLEIVLPKHTYGIYLIGGMNLTPHPDGVNGVQNLGVGLKYDRFEAGFIYSSFLGTIERRLIFPNLFTLDYQQGGGFVEYSIFQTQSFDLRLKGVIQSGDLVWERLDSGEDMFREVFRIWHIGINVESPYFKYIRPGLSVAYQGMSDISITGLNQDNFTGFFGGFTVKIGYFNQ